MVRFKIPFLPLSINSLYGVNARGPRVRVFLKPEGRRFKENAKLFMPPHSFTGVLRLRLEASLHGQWLCKNGKVRKVDLPNFEKVLIDAIAEKYLESKDELIWEKLTRKVITDDENFVTCTLEEIPDETRPQDIKH